MDSPVFVMKKVAVVGLKGGWAGTGLVDRGYKVGFLDIDTGLISHSGKPLG